MKLHLVSAALLFIILAGCGLEDKTPPASRGIINVSPSEAKALLDNKERNDLFVLNVHTPYEGKLEKTDAIIEDWENISAHLDQLPQDKTSPLLVYCRSGRMSSVAVAQLQKLGYTNIYHLNGGMNAWKSAGYAVID